MISELKEKDAKLYLFLKSRGPRDGLIRFDEGIWVRGLEKLSEYNKPKYFFEFEDRIIDEIVSSVLRYPSEMAKQEIMRIKTIVDNGVTPTKHNKTFIQSIRNSVAGAVAVAIKCL